MAGLAQTLQVGGIPEQRLITAMRPLVVSDQLRGVRLDAFAALALEQVMDQHQPSQLLPAHRLVPPAPCLRVVTEAATLCLASCLVGYPWGSLPTSGLRVLSLAKGSERLGEPPVVDAVELHASLHGRAVNNTLAAVIGDRGSDLDHGCPRWGWSCLAFGERLGELLVAWAGGMGMKSSPTKHVQAW